MTISAAIVLYAVLWFLALFLVLPVGVRTQEEVGRVVPGTPASAPADPRLRRKFAIATIIALAIWLPLCGVILWGGVTIRDLDIWGRM